MEELIVKRLKGLDECSLGIVFVCVFVCVCFVLCQNQAEWDSF